MATESAPPTRLSHRVLGILLAVLGCASIAFALMGLAITWIQELMLQSFPLTAPGEARPFLEFSAAFRTAWTVMRTHLPCWCVGGVGLVVSGWRLHELRRGSIALARLGCVLALTAMLAYEADCSIRAMPAMERVFAYHPFMPPGAFRLFSVASGLSSLLVTSVPFVVLLWGLRTPRPTR